MTATMRPCFCGFKKFDSERFYNQNKRIKFVAGAN